MFQILAAKSQADAKSRNPTLIRRLFNNFGRLLVVSFIFPFLEIVLVIMHVCDSFEVSFSLGIRCMGSFPSCFCSGCNSIGVHFVIGIPISLGTEPFSISGSAVCIKDAVGAIIAT